MSEYKTVVVDPPWLELGGGKCKRGADKHYDCASWQVALAVINQQRFDIARDSILLCWVTDNFLLDGIKLVDALGYKYKRTLVWVKAVQTQSGGFTKQCFGLGQYLRGEHELCLVCGRGRSIGLVQRRDVGSVLLAQKTHHSAKPDEFYKLAESLFPGPRLDVFARRRRDGWDSFGDEIDGLSVENKRRYRCN